MEEYFDVLDENGNKTGKTKRRSLVHKDGDWHKAVYIWIVNDKNEILLQQRSPNKDSYPNMWDISSAGHLTAGDDSVTGAIREIKEELGIDIIANQLKLIGIRQKRSQVSDSFINAEFNDVYLLRLSLDLNKITLQPDEVSAVKYVPLDEFKRMIKTNDESLLMHPNEFEMLFKAIDTPLTD